MKLISTSYRWLWRTWYKNLKGYYWDIRNGIANIFIFFEAVWWFRAWNWDGLAHLIEYPQNRCGEYKNMGPTLTPTDMPSNF